jgi:hypothetical protein
MDQEIAYQYSSESCEYSCQRWRNWFIRERRYHYDGDRSIDRFSVCDFDLQNMIEC